VVGIPAAQRSGDVGIDESLIQGRRRAGGGENGRESLVLLTILLAPVQRSEGASRATGFEIAETQFLADLANVIDRVELERRSERLGDAARGGQRHGG